MNVRRRIKALPAAEQAKILGDSLWRLFKAGIVGIDDLIDDEDQRPKTLAEVIRSLHLTNKVLLGVGIPLWLILLARKHRKPAKPAATPDPTDDGLDAALEAAHAPATAPTPTAPPIMPPDAGTLQAAELAASLAKPTRRRGFMPAAH